MISWSVTAASLWVIASTVTALLPMRLQFIPGMTLIILAPFLVLWLGYDFGWIWSGVAALAFVSMFRNPLRYMIARARGQNPEIPK